MGFPRLEARSKAGVLLSTRKMKVSMFYRFFVGSIQLVHLIQELSKRGANDDHALNLGKVFQLTGAKFSELGTSERSYLLTRGN